MEYDSFMFSVTFINIVIFILLLLTREKNRKIKFTKNVCFLTFIGLVCSFIAMPLLGPIFGFTSIVLNSIVVSTMFGSKINE